MSSSDTKMVPLQFQAGINRERTRYSSKGYWYDGNRVRFRDGQPENIRGWAIDVVNKYSGVPINNETKQEMLDSPILEVEKFIANEWGPLLIDNLIKNPRMEKVWNEVIKSGNKEEQRKFLSLILNQVIRKTFEKRSEMINTVPEKSQ